MRNMRGILLAAAVSLSLFWYASSSSNAGHRMYPGDEGAVVQSRDFRTFLGNFVARQNFFENPLMLALSMLLIALPMLPFIVLGPIALAGAKPALSAINNAVNNALEPFGVGGPVGPPPPPPGSQGGGPGGNNVLFHKRSVGSREDDVKTGSWPWDLVRTVKQGLRTYDITERECQLRMICEINRRTFSRSLGTFADRLIDIFGLDGRLERTRFKSSTKSILRTFLKAIRHGLTKKDCNTLYNQCTELKSAKQRRQEAVANSTKPPEVGMADVGQQPA